MYVLRSKLLGSIVLMPCLGEATIEKADFPLRIGYEASGVVIEVGEEVCIVPQMGLSQNGCYAEEIVVPSEYVALKPAGLTFAEGAAAWMQYLTVYGAFGEHECCRSLCRYIFLHRAVS
jgi:NADPH:quinone reductase-like Zn-dependent oxidoreductase